MTNQTILLTGGHGRLGAELISLIPGIVSPSRNDMDILDAKQTFEVVGKFDPAFIVHAAAYTNVSAAESEHKKCWSANVEGTRNVANAANLVNAKLIHISTDYVFSGESGNYSEDDSPGPVVNYYALTKLIAEESARLAKRHLILRTSFRPREFQYPVAFSDIYTGQDYVDIIAPMIAEVILNADAINDEILHVATARKSVYELALRRNPQVKSGKRSDVSVILPSDVSLNTERFQRLRQQWVENTHSL